MNKVIILGSGNSVGTPAMGTTPGGDWGTCDPSNLRNRRLRASIYVEYQGLRILVDTSSDLREQYLTNGLTGIDAVILTHAHADHISGIDNLRQVYFAQDRKPIPVYATQETFHGVQGTFGYLFRSNTLDLYPKALEAHVVDGDFSIGDVQIQVMKQPHGTIESLGLRFGNFAYSTDFKTLEEGTLHRLRGLDIWIVDCLDIEKEHPTHSSLPQTLRYIQEIQPKQAFLTHMSRRVDYEHLKGLVPPGVQPAYDGLTLVF
jgi:phosphoribosyl 1,2-cyclic phosphate phosphodiesterase